MIGSIFSEMSLPNLKVWHLILGALLISLFTSFFCFSVMFWVPKYFTYLEEIKMYRAVQWAETDAKIGMIIGPTLEKHPTLNYYLNQNK